MMRCRKNFLAALALGAVLLFPFSQVRAASILDQEGRTVAFSAPFARIISLYPAHTENLAGLGLDKEIIGIADSDDYPPELMDRPRFSYKEDPEKFIAARPDLVLVRPMIERSYPQLLGKLRQAGIVVVSLQPTGMAEIFAYWRKLGILTGREKEAEAMVRLFSEELARGEKIIEAVPAAGRQRVYFEAIHNKMKTFAPESIAVFVLSRAGGINVAADAEQVRETNIAFYGKERILARGEEIDVYLAQQGRMNPVDREVIANEPGFAAIRAVREGKVYLIDERLVSRPTMRILAGVRQIRELLYPSLAGGR
ncbi:ABC transporter substrate-binding protein [Thiovibrio sp. JS02]